MLNFVNIAHACLPPEPCAETCYYLGSDSSVPWSINAESERITNPYLMQANVIDILALVVFIIVIAVFVHQYLYNKYVNNKKVLNQKRIFIRLVVTLLALFVGWFVASNAISLQVHNLLPQYDCYVIP
jgi:hypothetical protein